VSIDIKREGTEVLINVGTLGVCFTFRRPVANDSDAAAVIEAIRCAFRDRLDSSESEARQQRERACTAERSSAALRGQVTRLKNRLAGQ